MFDSNLSKIKPKLRTQGAVTGNFGHAKTKAGSSLREIGETKCETVNIAPREEYIKRMLLIISSTQDASMKEFAYRELHRLNYIKQRKIEGIQRTAEPFKGPVGVS